MIRKNISNKYLTNIGPSHLTDPVWHAKGYNVQVTKMGRHYVVEVWYGPVEAEGSRRGQKVYWRSATGGPERHYVHFKTRSLDAAKSFAKRLIERKQRHARSSYKVLRLGRRILHRRSKS
jgi:hypothetical protein